MDSASKTGIWIIATGVIIAFLFIGREILAPFAMAVFLFLVMEGFASAIDVRSEILKRGGSRVISILLVLGGFVAYIMLMASGIAKFGSQASLYERRIDGLISDGYGLFGMDNAPSLNELAFGEPGQQVFSVISASVSSLSQSVMLILIYVAFLFLAQSTWSTKLDHIFPERARREKVREVGDAARGSIESYLWTQSVISALITLLTWITLTVLGVQNALFLAAVIFVLNYIPTIGSIIAAFVPLLFALVQPGVPDWVPGDAPQNGYIFAGIVFGAVSFWQFTIGNFLQPRMMSESLNLSALVVLLALAIWGAIWGIPGMFLSAPLTVLMMILFAQSKSTHWIAVMLSADGRPSELKKTSIETTATDHAK